MNQIPNEILISILARLSFNDLIKRASLTCKKWHSLIHSDHFWRQKIKLDIGIQLDPGHDLKSLLIFYLKKPLNRNLIKNPCFDLGLNHWFISDKSNKKMTSTSDMFMIEEYDECSVPSFNENKKPIKKFATSSSIVFKYQLIDLQSEGLSMSFFKYLKLFIKVKDSYAGRLYLGYEYYIHIILYDNNFNELRSIYYDEKVNSDNWSNSEWKEFEYKFEDLNPKLRFILFKHGGRDVTNWTGYYGVKLTNSQVTIDFDK